MKRKSIFLTFGLLVLSWIGCVENDLPYPTIVGQITEMEVAGMSFLPYPRSFKYSGDKSGRYDRPEGSAC